ncbi:MAG: acetylglutamate kinase [Chloroflexi bacterium]|jgi:acetylglutamate kinase|nr:acetylglutamate kinase [Chloroflexota bacterium]MBT7080444.1 acetylglutamate kinase [Chloroflexota bacterium]MBT7289603.1 acetylglutamate kinase [Chloroflexota bacterium]
MKKIVVKIGGSTLGEHDTTIDDIIELHKQGTMPVVVHGGGKKITEWLDKLGIVTEFKDGLRVTDEHTLEVVIGILCGVVNKELVAAINSRGGKAIGLCGYDGNMILAEQMSQEIGYVGEVRKVNPAPIQAVIDAGYIPVIAPGGHDGTHMLNVNADTVAGEVALAIRADEMIFLTDVAGVMDSSGDLYKTLYKEEMGSLFDLEVISGGMIPKMFACLRALLFVDTARIIDGRQSHALMDVLNGKEMGTVIK